MEIFGDTSSASLDRDRRHGGYSGCGGFRGEEGKREGGREKGSRDAGREDRVIYCEQYYRRHAERAGWEKPVPLSRPRNVFYSDRRWGSSYGATLLTTLSSRHRI